MDAEPIGAGFRAVDEPVTLHRREQAVHGRTAHPEPPCEFRRGQLGIAVEKGIERGNRLADDADIGRGRAVPDVRLGPGRLQCTASRNFRVRSCCGLPKNSAGGGASMMAPPSIMMTRSATRLANPTSCVPTTIVIPPRASP